MIEQNSYLAGKGAKNANQRCKILNINQEISICRKWRTKIVVKQLNEEQYLSTMGNKMNNVTESAEVLADIWSYAKQLLESHLLSEYRFSKRCVEAVYENDENTYQHILLFANRKNSYVVIIVDMIYKTILGHYILDLNEKYDLKNII